MFGGYNSGGGGFGGQQQQSTGFGAAPGGFGSTSSFGAPATGFGAAAQTTGFGGGAATTGFGAAPSTGGFGAAPASTGFGGGGGFGGSTPGFGVQAQQAQPQSGFGGSSFGGAGATSTPGSFGGFGATTSTGGFGSGGGFGAKPATTGFGAANTGFGATANTGFGGAATSTFGGGGMNAAAGQGTANPPFAPFVEKEPATGQNSHYQSITAMPAYRGFSFEELRLQDYQQGRKLGQGAAGGMGAGGFGAATSGFGAQPAATGFGAQPSTGFGATNTASTLGGFGAGSTGFGGAATGGGFGATSGFGSTTPATTGFGAQPAQTTGFGAPSTAFGGATTTGFGAPAATGFGGAGGFGAAAAPKPATGFGGFGAATSQPATGFGANPAFGGATTTPSLFGGAATGTGPFGAPAASTASTGFGGFGATATSAAPTSTGLGFGMGGSTAFGAAKPATGLFGAAPASSAAAPAFGGFGATPATSTGGGLFGGAATGSSLFPGTSTATTGGLFGGAGATAAPAFGAAPTTSLFGASKPAATGGLFSTAPSTGFGASPFGAGATTQPSLFGGAGTTGTPFGTSTATNFLGGSTANAQAQPSLVASVNSNIYGENPLFLRDSAAPAAKAQPAVLSRAEPAQKLPAFIPSVRFSPRHSHIRLRPSSTATFASSVNGTSDTGTGRKSLLLLDGINDDSAFPTDEYAPRRSVKKLDLKPRGQEDQISNRTVDSHRAGVTFNPALETAAESLNRRNGSDRPAFGFTGKATETLAPSFTTHETTSRQESSGAPQSTTRTKPEGEYWMSPSLEELRSLSNAELKRVENFKVGLPEFGSVDFQMPVDLSLVPLTSICGNIVVFEKKVCRVYPDETNKPPRGQGLNVPAIISLERCWPLDKTTQKPMVFDSNSPMYAKHLKRLKRQSETTFIDFTTDNGTWTFRVEHFSEYGLYDDEDEEETKTNAASTSSSRALPVTNQGYGHVDTDTSSMSDSPITGSERMVASNMVDSDMDSDSISDIFHRQLPGSAMDPQRQYMMKMSLFPEDSHEQKRTVKRAVWSSSPDFSEHEASGLGAELRPSFQQDHEQRAPLLSRPPRKFFRSTYEESIMSRKGNLLADAGLMMGRSCRVGWGPNGMLAVCGTICDFESVKERESDVSGSHAAQDTVSSSTVKLAKVKVVADAQEVEVARHITSLQAQLEHSKVVLDQKRLPRANITAGTSFSAMFHSLKSRQHPLSTEEINAWTLGHTLFDALPKSQNIDIDEPRELLETRARTIACGEWLSQVSKVVTEAELEKLSRSGTATALEDSVIALLVSNKRQRASIAAVQAKNPRLATLIAQTGRGSKSLSKVEDQLLLYKDQASGIKIPDFYLKALALLSGALTTDIAPKGEPSRYVTDGLDWRRTLGLHLWYSNTAEVDLTTALNEYVESLSQSSKIAKPLPTYQKQGASKSEHYDFLFQLIKLLVHPSTQLETVLHPLGISPSRLDYRQSWQFYMVLTQSLGVASFGSDSSHAIICNNFMSQLENLGLWQWAVFIALHLETSESREAAVRSLLERHIEIPRPLSSTGHSSSIELESIAGNGTHTSFLLKDLKIPEEWLWTARATQANYRGDLSLEVYSLLKSGEHQKAHVLILCDLAPLYVLYGGLETLGKLLGMVDQTKVANWANGGGLYQKYLECCSDSEGNVGEVKGAGRVTYASNIVYPDDIEAFQAAIRELLPKLPLLLSHGGARKNTQMQEICVAEMVSKCTNLLRDLAIQENTPVALPEFTMSEDQCVSSIQKISTDYFDEILASVETPAY
ncbi:hypothetical protein BGZ59_006911 [Podila verticillata]|nr:hypothetical protein BGZ59_006911 [Podila verticillata]KFH65732.1 hypothetical protein MVEG_07836 [Podila verticillata NRRL 6337]